MIKCCTVCGIEKPLEAFMLNSKSGKHLPRCKPCEADRIRAWKHANIERVREQQRGYAKAAYEKNPEKFREMTRAARTGENRPAYLLKKKEHYKKNAEARKQDSRERRALDPEAHRERTRKWFAENREKGRAYVAKRRLVVKQAAPAWDNELDDLVIEEAFNLTKLREADTGVPWQVDHIVPLNSKLVCGLHTASNIAVIPGIENLKKGNRFWPDMP